MNHVEPQSPGRDARRIGQGIGPRTAVDVPADRRDRGDAGQRVEDGGIADIARVQNTLDAVEGCERLGAQQSVGVGDDANARLWKGWDGCSSFLAE